MKTYKINGKEIQGLIEYNPNDLSVHSLTHQRDVLLKINELLEALSDKEEPKQSTSLKESIENEIHGLFNDSSFIPVSQTADKILSLIQSHLVKEIENMEIEVVGNSSATVEQVKRLINKTLSK